MSVLNQKTIKEAIVFDGIGLHSGKKVHIEIKPAKPNTGIVFKRVDIKNNNLHLDNVSVYLPIVRDFYHKIILQVQ